MRKVLPVLLTTCALALATEVAAASCANVPDAPVLARSTTTIRDMVIDDQCRYVYAATNQGAVEVLSLATRTFETPIPVPGALYSMDVSADGAWLYVVTSMGIAVVDTAGRTLVRTIPVSWTTSSYNDRYIAMMQNGRLIAGHDRQVFEIDPASGVATLIGDSDGVSSIERSADRTVMVGRGGVTWRGLYRYALDTKIFTRWATAQPEMGGAMATNADGAKAVHVFGPSVWDKDLRLLGRFTGTVSTAINNTGAMVVDPAGQTALVARTTGIEVLDLSTFRSVQVVPAGDTLTRTTSGRLALSVDGAVLAVASDNGISIRRAPVADSPALQVVAMSLRPQSNQSLFRFYNAGAEPSTVRVVLADLETGNPLVDWSSPPIAPGAAPQYALSTIEAVGGGFARPSYYLAKVYTSMAGTFAHVIWQPRGSLTNVTTCAANAGVSKTRAANVHSSIMDTQYPSYITVVNTGAAPAAAVLAVSNAATGQVLGRATTTTLASAAGQTLSIGDIEAAAGITPSPDIFHYVVSLENRFSGFIQHAVDNLHTGVYADMTNVCVLPGP